MITKLDFDEQELEELNKHVKELNYGSIHVLIEAVVREWLQLKKIQISSRFFQRR